MVLNYFTVWKILDCETTSVIRNSIFYWEWVAQPIKLQHLHNITLSCHGMLFALQLFYAFLTHGALGFGGVLLVTVAVVAGLGCSAIFQIKFNDASKQVSQRMLSDVSIYKTSTYKPQTIDFSTRLWEINPTNSVVLSSEPRTEVYCFIETCLLWHS